MLLSSKRLRLCGGLFLPASGSSLVSREVSGPLSVLNSANASVCRVFDPGAAEERRRLRRRLLGGGNCSSAVGDGRVEDGLRWPWGSEVDAGNTTGGIEVGEIWEEVPVLLERFGAVEVDGSSVMIGEERWVASSARSKWRQSRHFWRCGHSWLLLRTICSCSTRRCLLRCLTSRMSYLRK